MTYCLGLQCHEGLVLLSDSRTSAGVDNVTIHSKMRIYEVRGQRVFCLLTSGNLSITQSVISLLERDIEEAKEDPNVDTLLNQTNFLETVHYVGQRLRDVRRMHAEALDRAGISFNSNFILAGQIENQPPEIYQIYPEGNAIHASTESPFLQIGELKYGKPILDRVFTSTTSLAEAAKLGLLSLDATARSNLSVGTPFEMLAYRVDSLEVRHRMKFEENDPYLRMVCDRWQEGLIQLVHDIPELDVLKQ
jgi:putative proteasome-type protease